MEKKRHISILRILATITVITMHVGNGGRYASDTFVRTLVSAINTWCVPAFVMITGALFLRNGKSLDLKTHGKRILRLLGILLFWAFFYNLICVFFFEKETFLHAVLQAGKMALLADTTYCYHLWYLYMAIGLYLLLPVLNAYVERASRKEQLALTGICLTFTVLAPMLQSLLGAQESFWKGAFFFFGGFSGYLLLGFWLENYRLKKWAIYTLSISTAAQLVLLVILSLRHSLIVEWLSGYQTLYAAEMAALLYLLCRFLAKKCGEKLSRFIEFLASYSLPIYILHVMLLQALRKAVGLESTFAPLYISLPALTALAFGLSLLLAWLLKKIPVLRHIL